MAAEMNVHEMYLEEGASSSSASATIIDKSKAWIIAVLVAINLVATVVTYHEWSKAETESRMLEYYVMEMDGKLMAAGIIQPPESWSGRKHK
jgi:hypothetical protein